jgi:hypothetical protein
LAGGNSGRCADENPNNSFSTASNNRRFLIIPIRAAVLLWSAGSSLGTVPDASNTASITNSERNLRPMNCQLSLRFPRNNPNHHLWNNHGTWWCHFTEHLPDFTKRRVRINLGTGDLHAAREKRDKLLLDVNRRTEGSPANLNPRKYV